MPYKIIGNHGGSHYTVWNLNQPSPTSEFHTDEEVWSFLKMVFSTGADELNWLLASTSGIHGDYTDLDDIESSIRNGFDKYHEYYRDTLTVSIYKPRLCQFIVGTVKVENLEQVQWLRKVISDTVNEVIESQKHNGLEYTDPDEEDE